MLISVIGITSIRPTCPRSPQRAKHLSEVRIPQIETRREREGRSYIFEAAHKLLKTAAPVAASRAATR